MEPISAQIVLPQRVRWGPSDGRQAGIRVWDSVDIEQQFVPWSNLREELMRNLLPQLFANPEGVSFETRDYHGKKEWLVQLFQQCESYCDVWFGDDPGEGWKYDGMIHIGDAENVPHVWQSYQRYSDGTYRRLQSLVATLDEVSRGNGPIALLRPPSRP